jgi:hypothetical protein
MLIHADAMALRSCCRLDSVTFMLPTARSISSQSYNNVQIGCGVKSLLSWYQGT